MFDTSKERIEEINLEAQKSGHRQVLEKFEEMELSYYQHIEELRDIIITKTKKIVKHAVSKYLQDREI